MTKKSGLKVIILLLLTAFLFFSCSSNKEDEAEIEKVVLTFYKAINKEDYKQVESLISSNMRQDTRRLRYDIKEFVKYKKFYVKDIELNSLNAVVSVETTDIFNNTVETYWDLIKVNDSWRINNFNTSKAQSINNITPSKTEDTNNANITKDTLSDAVNNLSTETNTEKES